MTPSRGQPLSWPEPLPAWGPVRLRPFEVGDLALVADLSTDPYLPLIGTIPAVFTEAGGLAFIERQHQRLTDGTGWSFAVVDVAGGHAVGSAGLWLHDDGPATAGYAVGPSWRGRGFAVAALAALTSFAGVVDVVERVELMIEPWNTASIRTAERCGYTAEAVLPESIEIGSRKGDFVRYAREV